MTFDDFKATHKENVLKGFDGLDGEDYWALFKADLHTLLADERKRLEHERDVLYSAMFQIVGIMQGSGVDKQVFEKVYKIAIENTIKNKAAICPVQVNCHGGKCGKLQPCEDHDVILPRDVRCMCGVSIYTNQAHQPGCHFHC